MATLVLSTAGAALGSVFGPIGTMVGRAAGAAVGGMVDGALFAPKAQNRTIDRQGPQLKALDVQASTEGAAIPRLYGRSRLTGQIIWATRFEEVATTTTETSGGGRSGKGGGGGGASQPSTTITTTTYSYFANFAVALCEGEVSHIGRIWADGKLLDTGNLTVRYYRGTKEQLPDPLIDARAGAGNAPAYRGVAYVVFERLALAPFGNRLPQLSFEVVRAIDSLEKDLKSLCIIPGATEFGYDTVRVVANLGEGRSKSENAHFNGVLSDFVISIDELLRLCPNLEQVALIVPWFGNDLRASHCQLKPGVELGAKNTSPYQWQVNGLARSQAHQISLVDGVVSHGGTPSDASVIRAISFFKTRGLKVVFYPFILMDVPPSNSLPNPYTGTSGQPAYPWRGRITLSLAPHLEGSPDNSSAAGSEIAAFLGSALRTQFSKQSLTTSYTGANEWSYRRMILHYAWLCEIAGGVEAFLLGSEMVSLTKVRNARQSFPFVEGLKSLAVDLKAILPATKISYAADWSEYGAYQPQDGSGDLLFPLDRLWGDGNIDFIGIDNYLPLSDWRDGEAHTDYDTGFGDDDQSYLGKNIAGGEYFNWYYADGAGREAQTRLPITDGAYEKPWVYRAKDILSFWQNTHYERLSGVEEETPTPWAAESKPIWFTEFGCPSVDKGANQPNVFFDPKSSESALPYFSNGERNDSVQRAYLKAMLAHFGASGAHNPVSEVYGAPMVSPSNMFAWAWDARPYPAFPYRLSIWADGENWQRGHWLNGRLGSAPISGLVAQLREDFGITTPFRTNLSGVVEGFVLDRPMSFRQAIEAISGLFGFSAFEEGEKIAFLPEGARGLTLSRDDLVMLDNAPLITDIREQETETAAALNLGFQDSARDFRPSALKSQTAAFDRGEMANISLPIVTTPGQAANLCENWLMRQRAGRTRRTIALSSRHMGLEPGDVIGFEGEAGRWRVEEIADGAFRKLSLSRLSARAGSGGAVSSITEETEVIREPGVVIAEVLDLPLIDESRDAPLVYLAGFANPWPGSLSVYRVRASGITRVSALQTPAMMGETLSALDKGALWRLDHANQLTVRLYRGVLESITDDALLAGGNALALKSPNGWEIIQFKEAELVGERTYTLSKLLRGQKGTEHMMADNVASGARVVILNEDLVPFEPGLDGFGNPLLFRIGPSERSYEHPSYAEVEEATWAANALKPLSPVHAKAERFDGSIRISFIRRTRIGGDSWAFSSQPLGEPTEQYEIDVLSAEGNLLRTLSSSTPEVVYTDELEDFADLQTSLSLSITQLSPRIGRGVAREVEVMVG